MQIRNTAIAGLTLSLTLFTLPALAQVSGMGAASGSGQIITNNVPAAGAPGTQAPASGAPLGAAVSDWMSQEGRPAAAVHEPMSEKIKRQTQARQLQVQTGRDITAARAQGKDIGQAARQRWLGSVALQKGDREGAIGYFQRADDELRRGGYAKAGANSGTEARHAQQTSRATGAININPNRGATAVSAY